MVDVPSSIEEEQTDPRIPTITVTNDFATQLESMRTLGDEDDDELFLAELLAIHPNDQDIVVEDLEQVDPPEVDFSDEPGIALEHLESPTDGVEEAQEAEEDGVSTLMQVFAVSLSAVASFWSFSLRYLFLVSPQSLVYNFRTRFYFEFFFSKRTLV